MSGNLQLLDDWINLEFEGDQSTPIMGNFLKFLTGCFPTGLAT